MSIRPRPSYYVVPHDLQSELNVIGFFAFYPVAFPTHGRSLNADAFFTPGARAIFKALAAIDASGGEINSLTVGRRLESYDLSVLADAMGSCPLDFPSFFMAYAHLRSLAATRARLGIAEAS